jgi:hypothetical protein
MLSWVKKIYIYLFSAIGLVLVIIGGVQIINLGLKMFIFTKADIYVEYPRPVIPEEGVAEEPEISKEELKEYQKENLISRRQRQAANAIALIIIGSPLFLYHWQLAKKMKDI